MNRLLFFLLFTISHLSNGQEKFITGVVSDESGYPLRGVQVINEITREIVQTDFDGKYSLKAKPEQKITFSLPGMTPQTATVGKSIPLNIVLFKEESIIITDAYRTTTRFKDLGYLANSNIPNAEFTKSLQEKLDERLRNSIEQSCICKYYQYVYWDAEALDTFTFKNGESLKICPAIRNYIDNDNQVYFKDFAIEQCKNDSIVFVGKGYTFYTVHLKEDILIVNEVIDLPTGKERSTERVILSNNKITFENGKFKVTKQFNPIRRYTSEEILLTLSEYESKRRISDKNLTFLISRLFVAALSDEKAKQYFLNLSNKFSIDEGKPLERYQDLMELFEAIQSNQYGE